MIAYFSSGCDCFFDQIQIRPVYKKGGIRYTENARNTFQNSVQKGFEMEDFEQNQNYEMIKERMKERPINRKKLMRRMMITVSMAVIFGVFACFTFLVLEPVFSNLLYPEPAPEAVELPKEEDEVLPEDMLITEEETTIEVRPTIIQRDSDVIEEYVSTYQRLYEITTDFRKSMVTVTGVSQDVDWFNNEYESRGLHSGIVYASTSKQFLILVDSLDMKKAEEITVTFQNGEAFTGEYVQQDKNTGLSVVAVALNEIPEETMNRVQIASLGSSRPLSLLASPVIVVGRPYGNTESVAYGMITSRGNLLSMADCNYDLLTTDIYGSKEATGFMINLSGEVLGIIKQDHNAEPDKNFLSAIGITEIKNTLEIMSNGREMPYLGVKGIDVTKEANESLGVPMGAYVKEIIMDSPAMKAGIQSGDIIIRLGETDITSFKQYTEELATHDPEETVNVVIKRQGGEGYSEISIPIILGKLK